MTLLEANLAALDRFHPEAAQVLRALPEAQALGQWAPSRRGPVTVRRGGLSLVSSFDPVTEAERAVPTWDQGVDAAVVPSLGAGYLLEAASVRYPDLPLVLAEADPRWFREVLVHRDLTQLWARPGLRIVLGPEPRLLGEVLESQWCRCVVTLEWRPHFTLDPAWHRAVADQVAQAQARAGVNGATFRRFGRLWLRNLRRNEAQGRDLRPLAALTGLCPSAPAVVAAAGPSLADALPWIEAHRHRAVLIAVDTAWPALAARGLEPDFLVVLDGQYWNGRHVDRDPPARTLVVTEWIGPPRAFRLAPGRTFVAATSLALLRPRERARWGDLGALPTGGSVATAAWSLALVLGCSEVAFAGLDLGYPQGQTHVPGSQFEEALHRRASRLVPAETLGLGLRGTEGLTARPSVDGGTVLSDPRMDLFRDWLAASVARHPGVRAVNLSTRGTRIPGLASPPPDYGDQWPPLSPLTPPRAPALKAGQALGPKPPFDLLRTLAQAPDFPQALDHAWKAAAAFWGEETWQRWAGRARASWDRFPGPRGRRAVLEAVDATLAWEEFWESE